MFLNHKKNRGEDCICKCRSDIIYNVVVCEEDIMKKKELMSMVKILKVAAVSLFVLSNMCCEGMSFTEFAQSPKNSENIIVLAIVNRNNVQYSSILDLQAERQWTYKDVRDNWNALLSLSSENVDTIGVREGCVMSERAKELMNFCFGYLRAWVQCFSNYCDINVPSDNQQLSDVLNKCFWVVMKAAREVCRWLEILEYDEVLGIDTIENYRGGGYAMSEVDN
jgi:hypothetical protein